LTCDISVKIESLPDFRQKKEIATVENNGLLAAIYTKISSHHNFLVLI